MFQRESGRFRGSQERFRKFQALPGDFRGVSHGVPMAFQVLSQSSGAFPGFFSGLSQRRLRKYQRVPMKISHFTLDL